MNENIWRYEREETRKLKKVCFETHKLECISELFITAGEWFKENSNKFADATITTSCLDFSGDEFLYSLEITYQDYEEVDVPF